MSHSNHCRSKCTPIGTFLTIVRSRSVTFQCPTESRKSRTRASHWCGGGFGDAKRSQSLTVALMGRTSPMRPDSAVRDTLVPFPNWLILIGGSALNMTKWPRPRGATCHSSFLWSRPASRYRLHKVLVSSLFCPQGRLCKGRPFLSKPFGRTTHMP